MQLVRTQIASENYTIALNAITSLKLNEKWKFKNQSKRYDTFHTAKLIF